MTTEEYESQYTEESKNGETLRQVNDNKNNKSHKQSHPFLAKLGTGAACGVAFGLAAALVFAGIVKASGLDRVILSDTASNDTKQEQLIEKDKLNNEDIADNEKGDERKKEDDEGAVIAEHRSSSDDLAGNGINSIVKEAMPSVVSITNTGVEEVRSMFGTRQYESTSMGSGIIIGENDEELLIATNNHVVDGASELSVCFDDDKDKVVSAKIKGTDSSNDLAIIAIRLSDLSDAIRGSYKIAKIGSSDDLEVGDQVIAIGNALGYGQSVTTGIVSALDREVTIDNFTAKLIQTDAAINPGNSGGALLNMKGELVGINSSKFAATKVEGIGYAIPIDTAEPILENLMSRETRDVVDEKDQGFLGISCQNVTEEISQLYSMPRGIYIVDVQSGSGAEKAGLKKGDILTKLEGTEIRDYADLRKQLTYYKAGETIKVTVQVVDDNGEYAEKEVDVELSKASDAAPEGGLDQNEDEDTQQNKIEEYDMNDLFDQFFNYGY